jgi:DNA-binding MarR family transcriptional regulator
MSKRKPEQVPAQDDRSSSPSIDLEDYVPAHLTFITNKLARGASQHYLDAYGVGIETWRVLVMLAIEQKITAQRVVQVIGMDKASVSRAFRTMHEQGLIEFSSDSRDGRLRYATFTTKGRDLHDRILRLARVREEVLLSGLTPQEVRQLIDMLRRLQASLPAVEQASKQFVAQERAARDRPSAKRKQAAARTVSTRPSRG